MKYSVTSKVCPRRTTSSEQAKLLVRCASALAGICQLMWVGVRAAKGEARMGGAAG